MLLKTEAARVRAEAADAAISKVIKKSLTKAFLGGRLSILVFY